MSANPSLASLDSLRTVEFRQTLRGYHIDDVDEYLERVAVEAEALQEQLRQQGERLRQASERIATLEQELEGGPRPVVEVAEAPVPASGVTEDALQRTLVLAQKFVDQTHAEAEAEAKSVLSDAQEKARALLSDAEHQVKTMSEQAESRLREDVARLEALRTKLAGDVETISGYLDAERTRLRGFLGEMLRWVDENVQPTANVSAKPAERPDDGAPRPVTAPAGAPTATVAGSGTIAQAAPGNPPAAPADAAPRQGLMSLGGPNNGAPR